MLWISRSTTSQRCSPEFWSGFALCHGASVHRAGSRRRKTGKLWSGMDAHGERSSLWHCCLVSADPKCARKTFPHTSALRLHQPARVGRGFFTFWHYHMQKSRLIGPGYLLPIQLSCFYMISCCDPSILEKYMVGYNYLYYLSLSMYLNRSGHFPSASHRDCPSLDVFSLDVFSFSMFSLSSFTGCFLFSLLIHFTGCFLFKP